MKNTLIPKAVLAGVLSVGLVTSFSGVASATEPANAERAGVNEATLESPTDEQRAEDLTEALESIVEIPDDVLVQGDAAVQEWRSESNADAGDPNAQLAPQASILACTGAIATVIASTAFPAAKILKIKKLVKGLGGVKEAVQVMWGASFSYEKMQALGGAAAALAGELIGITAVKKGCFK